MQVMSDDVSPTLREQMKHHEPIVCYSVGADLTWQGCSGLTQTATTLDTAARTLSKSQPKTCAVVCYAEKRFFEWHEDDKSVNIRASSGSYGGGQRSACLYQKTVGALCGTDHKWIQQQQVMQGKLIVECLTKK